MPTDEQYEELRRTVAALTERIYRLEQLAGLREGPAPIPSVERSHHNQKSRPESGSPASSSPIASRSNEIERSPHDDFESEVGGHWLNRVGIVAVLMGVSYFLKYAFDNQWIGPAGRVVIGLISGLAIVIWSEHLRKRSYVIFSYSLKATGIGVLYLSLWASSQLYRLVSTEMAFAAMVSVSAATIAMALWQDAEVIAAFAAFGAFITPVALYSGENHAGALFLYIALLDIGALVLMAYRSWTRILVGSFVASVFLYATWYVAFYGRDQFMLVLLSASALFAIFVATPFVNRGDSTPVMFVALMNGAVFFFEIWKLFNHEGLNRESAEAAALLGCLYFFLSGLLQMRASKLAVGLHAAIGAAFLVIAVPLGLEAKWITIGWLIEGAALIEVSHRARNDSIRLLGGAALLLGTCRILVVDQFEALHPVLNERMLISLVAVAALGFAAIRWKDAAGFLTIAINVVALTALNREVSDAFQGIARDFAYSALWMIFGAGLMSLGFWKRSRFLRWQALVLISITVLKVFLYDISSLDRGYRILSFIALGLLLLATSFMYHRDWLNLRGNHVTD
jgi:uncharacterized membrane protein